MKKKWSSYSAKNGRNNAVVKLCMFTMLSRSAIFKGALMAEYNLPLKYCIYIVLAKKIIPPPFGLKKVTALVFLFNSEIAGTHF